MEIPEKNSLDRFIKWNWHEKDLLNMKWYQQIIHSEKVWGKKSLKRHEWSKTSTEEH